jgi:hypothetical protein
MMYNSVQSTIKAAASLFYRLTEDGVNRSTEDNQQRITEE